MFGQDIWICLSRVDCGLGAESDLGIMHGETLPPGFALEHFLQPSQVMSCLIDRFVWVPALGVLEILYCLLTQYTVVGSLAVHSHGEDGDGSMAAPLGVLGGTRHVWLYAAQINRRRGTLSAACQRQTIRMGRSSYVYCRI